MTDRPIIKPTVIDDAYMERFTNEQLAYKAWSGADLAQEILFDDEMSASADCVNDAKYEVAITAAALRVLVLRLTGMTANALCKAVNERRLEVLVMSSQLPPGETLQ
jgi:hypothetical protein